MTADHVAIAESPALIERRYSSCGYGSIYFKA
jgi:hypothetical protein